MSNMAIERIGQFIDGSSLRIEAPENAAPEIADKAEGKSFGDLLSASISKANELQLEADHGIRELAAGRNKNIHETMLMLEKADTSFRLMMQVRNKIIDAYREIMRMQV